MARTGWFRWYVLLGGAVLAGCGGGGGGGAEDTPLTWVQLPIADRTASRNTSAGGYVALADFDADGRLDAASGFSSSSTVVVHMQTAPRNWTSTTVGQELGAVHSLATADLDNSSEPDIVAATGSGAIWILLAPRFAGPAPASWRRSALANPAFVTGWSDVKIGQFDAAPPPEIVGTSVAGKVICLWRSESLVTSAENYQGYVIATASGDGYSRLATGDVDGDGDLDVVAIGPASGVIWLENLGGVNVTTSWPVHRISTRSGSSRVVAVDLDRNGTLDVAVTDERTGDVLWFENRGSPRTDPWPVHVIASVSPGTPQGLSAGDLDQDGRTDLLVGTAGTDPSIYWLRPYNDPRFQWQVQVAARTQFDVGEVPVGNIDGAGGVDFATTLVGSETPVVWFQQQ